MVQHSLNCPQPGAGPRHDTGERPWRFAIRSARSRTGTVTAALCVAKAAFT